MAGNIARFTVGHALCTAGCGFWEVFGGAAVSPTARICRSPSSPPKLGAPQGLAPSVDPLS